MATNRDQFRRLMLQVERDLLAQAHLRELLTSATTTVALHRRELRAVRSRIAHARPRRSALR
jgi:post-segregation antitoxin (ccd killing protein)